MSYAIVMDNNYLEHHGIQGQKWGVRRYQNSDGTLTAAGKARYGSSEYYDNKSQSRVNKMNSSKTRIGKNFNNYSALVNKAKANRIKNFDKDGINLIKQFDNVYGHGRFAADQKASSEYYTRKADYSKTRLGKTYNNALAFNNKQYAKQNEKLHNSKNVKEYVNNYIDTLSNTKVKTWSGRETTSGKQFVDNLFTWGVYGTIQDFSYYKEHKYD